MRDRRTAVGNAGKESGDAGHDRDQGLGPRGLPSEVHGPRAGGQSDRCVADELHRHERRHRGRLPVPSGTELLPGRQHDRRGGDRHRLDGVHASVGLQRIQRGHATVRRRLRLCVACSPPVPRLVDGLEPGHLADLLLDRVQRLVRSDLRDPGLAPGDRRRHRRERSQ